MIKLYSSIEVISNKWDRISVPRFLHLDFLKVYYNSHPKVKHLFFMDTNMRLYAHIFKLRFGKAKHYMSDNLISNFLLKSLGFDVLYLTNSFITNIPAFINDKKIDLQALLNTIDDTYSLIVIPDFLYEKMLVKHSDYNKVEVEEEMVLDIRQDWQTLDDYIASLRKKYRNKVKGILAKSSSLDIRSLDTEYIDAHSSELQKLFDQLVVSSRFKGPVFNVLSFASFVAQGYMKVDGYFLDGKLIGFSSEMHDNDLMYSYFVGFDKDLNLSFPIYGRILIENIANAIKSNKSRLILGRTANEYKSNFGAFPIKSYVYIRARNSILRTILKPIYKKLRIRSWQIRSPFKV